MSEATSHRFATRAIRGGGEPDPLTGSLVPPIYQVSTGRQPAVGQLLNGWEYSRSGNPTRSALTDALAVVEGGGEAFAAASGLAAEDVLLRSLLRPGDHVIIPNDAYGGTFRLFDAIYGTWGVEYTPVPVNDIAAFEQAFRPGQTKLIWIETPTNPLLSVADIAPLAEFASGHGLIVVVDNTFASPALQQPLALGADVVIHSTTKYIGGHSDVIGGAIVVREGLDLPEGTHSHHGGDDAAGAIGYILNAAGSAAGPHDAWLTLRGLRTLDVRMRQHSANARRLAHALEEDPRVRQVIYPGLESHPDHEVAARQMSDFGGMISIRLNSPEEAVRLAESTAIFTLAESLGSVDSLIEVPAAMTHQSVAGTSLEVPADLVRLSVGLEDADDLLADLDRALG